MTLKKKLPFHKSLQLVERDQDTYAIIVTGIETSPEKVLNQSGFNIKKVYPVEGV